MDSPRFDENVEHQYMPSRWGYNLKGASRIERFLHLCDIQNERAKSSYSVEYISYGADERQGLNILKSTIHQNGSPVVVFVHGGYWIEGDRHKQNFIANGLHAHNINVALLGYRLAAQGHDLASCISDVAAGIQEVQALFPESRIVLAGHSAGAHLVLCALKTLPSLKGLCKVVCISGVYSLSKIVNTSVGVQLQITHDQAESFSVSTSESCYDTVPVHILVGQFDPPEFQRQADQFANDLQMNGYLKKPVQVLPNEDHFSLIENLYFCDSALAQYLAVVSTM